MTPAQHLAREIADTMRGLESRLGPDTVADDQTRAAVERAGRSLTALGALVGVAPRVDVVTTTGVGGGFARRGEKCPACGETLRLVPTAGFGTKAKDICGACGYEPAA